MFCSNNVSTVHFSGIKKIWFVHTSIKLIFKGFSKECICIYSGHAVYKTFSSLLSVMLNQHNDCRPGKVKAWVGEQYSKFTQRAKSSRAALSYLNTAHHPKKKHHKIFKSQNVQKPNNTQKTKADEAYYTTHKQAVPDPHTHLHMSGRIISYLLLFYHQ